MKHIAEPVVMETHGGKGELFEACYRGVNDGVVFEKDPKKSKVLGRQRPTWAVYEADCVYCLGVGIGDHLEINLLDVDPYGDPWPAVEAFFKGERPRVDKLFVAVNDGLRQSTVMKDSWNVETLRTAVSKYGNDLHGIYLEVCKELMAEKASLAGYDLTHFFGYYCGHTKQMTHYLALLEK